MMLKRRHSVFATWLMLALLLFAQAAQAALPCLTAGSDPVMAYSDHDDEACRHTANPNACLTQCNDAAQPASHGDLSALAAPLTAVLTVPQPLPARVAYSCDAVGLRVAPDPPISIRYCSYLN